MSIQTEIERIANNIAESYSVASDIGATLPEEQNSDNLAATLRSITTGGGIMVTGATVGQTIKIAEVDGEGKPTAWEAVDFPNDTEISLTTIHDSGVVAIPAGTVEYDTGITVEEMGDYAELTLQGNVVGEAWVNVDMKLIAKNKPGNNFTLVYTVGKYAQNSVFLRRLERNKNRFMATLMGRGNGNMALYPPSAANMYGIGEKVALGYTNEGEGTLYPLDPKSTVRFEWSANTSDTQMRFVIIGILKYK